MRKLTIVAGVVLLAGAIGVGGESSATKPDDPAKATADDVAREIVRLSDPSPAVQQAAAQALRKIKKPAIPALIKVLGDPRDDVRARVAEVLRALLAADPASAPNYHDETYWKQRIEKIKRGMLGKEAFDILGVKVDQNRTGGLTEGAFSLANIQLDDYWMAVFSQTQTRGGGEDLHSRIVTRTPTLHHAALNVWVQPPKNFTGTWTTWRVNGQKWREIQFRDGKSHGVSISFHDNGVKSMEQPHGDGTHRAWHRSGRKSYLGEYRNGKPDGDWTHWTEKGEIESEQTYKDGKLIRSWHKDS